MDSKPIAERLEKDYPSPSLHLDSPILEEVYPAIGKIAMPLRAVWLPRVPVNLLNERSSEYFHRTREQGIGKPLTQFMKEEGGEEAWVEALPAIKALGELVKKNGGPYVMGKTRRFIPSEQSNITDSSQHLMPISSLLDSSNSSR